MTFSGSVEGTILFLDYFIGQVTKKVVNLQFLKVPSFYHS